MHDARLTKCFVSLFGTDIPDANAAAYVAAKIRSGGLGALVLANEIARAEACGVVAEIRYYHDAGKCGEPNCGNPAKYPAAHRRLPELQGRLPLLCLPGLQRRKPLPNVLVNGGYSCTVFCTTGFTVISDTPC